MQADNNQPQCKTYFRKSHNQSYFTENTDFNSHLQFSNSSDQNDHRNQPQESSIIDVDQIQEALGHNNNGNVGSSTQTPTSANRNVEGLENDQINSFQRNSNLQYNHNSYQNQHNPQSQFQNNQRQYSNQKEVLNIESDRNSNAGNSHIDHEEIEADLHNFSSSNLENNQQGPNLDPNQASHDPLQNQSIEQQNNQNLNPNYYLNEKDPPQDPDFSLKVYKDDDESEVHKDNIGILNISQKRRDELLCEMAYYKNLIEEQIVHGYHIESRARHDNGIHHQEFLKNKEQLEVSVFEYLRIMSYMQKNYQQEEKLVQGS